jgi:hypothetical protein
LTASARAAGRTASVLGAIHHDAERRHQFAPLLRHIAVKERHDLGRDFEQTVVENDRGCVGDRRDFGEGRLHEIDLMRSHGIASPVFG